MSTTKPPVTPATGTEWRRRRQASGADLPPPNGGEKPRNGFRVPAYATAVQAEDMATEFAQSQRAGLIAMLSIAEVHAPPRRPGADRPDTSWLEPRTSLPGEAASVLPAQVLDRPGVPAHVTDPAWWPTTAAPGSPEPSPGKKSRLLAHLPKVLPLIVILTVQATLSARLIFQYTAFNDEALYLWAGRVEWSHWLHGTPVPLFQTYFSGAPVIYPPLGALVNSIGGLQGARILSLCFMLGATVLLWSTASRLYGRWAACFAAGLWAILGPTQHLSAYATYDAMALFLVALAAWCSTGRRDKEDATGWILAAAGALALANATKYASAIFDPVVIGLAVASAWPHPGGKVAIRRGTLLTACMTGTLALMVRFGGPLYLRGVEQTTLSRSANTSPVLAVLGQSWTWVGVVAVIAGLAVILSWRRPVFGITALLASAVLLVPIEQSRIHTTTSLNKHVDFGAWFAAIAAGYAIARIATLPRAPMIRFAAVSVCVIGLFAASQAGTFQARNMLYGYWPNEGSLVAALRPLTAHGGRFLSEGQYIPVYYLSKTSWQDWSNTRSVRMPDGNTISVPVGAEGNPAVYKSLITSHYFSVVLLTFTDTVALDNAITRDLHATKGYRIANVIPFGPTRNGDYTIWVYQPQRGAR
jgi:hypothetical protein